VSAHAFAHGLVVGKFYPPHLGHHLLVDEAAAACARVTVVVAASSVESIPLADRVAWMRATHAGQPHVRIVGATDDHPIDYTSDAAWTAHVAVFRSAVARAAILDGVPERAPVDAVFSSEPYGEELARRFGATSVVVDLERRRRPTSSSAIRADVGGRWDDLAPATRAGLALRVVFVGAESTGTTTVSRLVAERLGTTWVPEYGRDYTVDLLVAGGTRSMGDLVWTTDDFTAIAERQVALEDEAAARCSGGVVVCDTDAFATGIWHERYLGTRSAAVEAWAAARPHPLYLLTSHEGVPFEQDGIRDGEHLRAWMTGRFAEALTATGRAWRLLTGTVEDRVGAALAAVEELRRTAPAWRFAEPLLPAATAAVAP
jgi:HTH-type transcriptional regulator, transcriptional repressor of NAD biosynthesis genes